MFDPVAELLELTGPRPDVLVAFSGGVDSTALAHALQKQRRKLGALRLAHVDHGLQPASAAWSRHCARQARTWRIPIVLLKTRVQVARGESPEAAARAARYALLAQQLREGETLVTAQHRDDQAETLLIQLFRGAGIAGLAAMPPRADFARGQIVRPMLGLTRAQVEAYAREHRLKWVEDPSNQSERFTRNFLRHRVMPLLRERWKGVDAAIARSARHVAEAAGLVDGLAQRDLAAVADGAGLNAAALRALGVARRRNVIRAWLSAAGLEAPSTAQINEMSGALLLARADAQPEVSWPQGRVSRRGGRLQLAKGPRPRKADAESDVKSWRWNDDREFVLNDSGDRLILLDDPAGPVDLARLPELLELRPRQGGETLRPGPRARTRALKKLLQAAKLSVEERRQLPLLFAAEGPRGRPDVKLIAAGDRWIDASVLATVKSRRRARLVWQRE
jgi:tRNA(Ile)-lysidine synthase